MYHLNEKDMVIDLLSLIWIIIVTSILVLTIPRVLNKVLSCEVVLGGK
jgi:hypothetical protein